MAVASEQFYVRVAGRVTGPFTVARLREMKRIGRLPAFCELSRDRQKWEPAAEIFNEPEARTVVELQAANGPPTSEQWYYTDAAGERIGPVPRSTIVSLATSAEEETLVWKEGMEDWQSYFTVFPRRVIKGQHKLAEVGALLLMIAGWLWVASLATLTGTFAVSLMRGKLITMAIFLPGILGLANLVVTIVGKSLLLTAPAGHGTRASLITSLSFAVVYLFLLPFLLIDFTYPIPDRFGEDSGSSAPAWIPIVSTMPFASVTATSLIYAKGAGAILVLILILGWLEIGRLSSALFALRAVSMTCRSDLGRMMCLSTLIAMWAITFVTNLAVVSVAQHLQTTLVESSFNSDKYIAKVYLWTLFSVYASVIVIAVLNGLSATFTYTALKKAKL